MRGYCLAGGFGLATSCDFVVASDDAVFAAPEIDVGLWPMMITVPLIRAMPAKKALELMMTGRRVSAAEGERIGFATQVAAADHLDETVATLANSLAAKSPTAISLGRRAFFATLDMDTQYALGLLQAQLTILASSEDAKEGSLAFREKRKANWKGR